jgi:predicted outer membrane repeat protein
MLTILSLLCPLATGATFNVDSTGVGPYTTIQSAISVASSGDIIEVHSGTYVESLNTNTKNLTIRSIKGKKETNIDAKGADWVINTGNANLQLSGFTIRNEGGRGIFSSGGEVSIEESSFIGLGNYKSDGGALYLNNTTTTINRTSFERNIGYYGGAIVFSGKTLSVTSSEFEENSSEYGGAIFASNALALIVSLSDFNGNYAYYDGGAVYNDSVAALTSEGNVYDANTSGLGSGAAVYSINGSDMTDTGSTYLDNYTYYYGGAIYTHVVTLNISDAVFQDNFSNYAGGALYHAYGYGSSDITDTTLDGNESLYDSGGALLIWDTDLTMSRVTLTNNQSDYTGGGLYHYNGNLSLEDCVFRSNTAGGNGGALYSSWSGIDEDPLIIRGLFEHNQSVYEGGAIAVFDAYQTIQLIDNDIYDNSTGPTGFGGGIFIARSVRISAQRNRVTGNRSGYGGGLYVMGSDAYDSSDDIYGDALTNNIFLNNIANVGGALCLSQTGYIAVTNNTMAGNVAHDLGGTACLYEANVQFYNNIFSFTTESKAIYTYAGKYSTITKFAYNDWYRNDVGDLGGAVKSLANSALTIPPQFSTWTHNGDPSDDSVVLSLESNLRDAGHPNMLDPDGSRADIGAYGGPDAQTDDLDGDGFDTTVDCDDTDDSIHPGAEDTPYDGINSDCLPGSDYDLDGDGVDAAEYGGEDCDDTDPTTTAPCDDTTSTTDTTVTPGERPPLDAEPDSACGCSATSRSAPLYLLSILSLFIISRRQSGQPHAIYTSC